MAGLDSPSQPLIQRQDEPLSGQLEGGNEVIENNEQLGEQKGEQPPKKVCIH